MDAALQRTTCGMGLRGFLTKQLRKDRLVRGLVKSCGGKSYSPIRRVHKSSSSSHWPFFEYGGLSRTDDPCVVMGILRGTNRIIKHCQITGKTWYYFDNGYMFGPRKIDDDPAYSLTKNALRVNKLLDLNEFDRLRIEKWKKTIPTTVPKKTADPNLPVLVCPPTEPTANFYGFTQEAWLDTNLTHLRKLTNKIIIRPKTKKPNENEPISEVLNKVSCVFASQSSVGIDAIRAGVPVICDEWSMCMPVSQEIHEVEAISSLRFPKKPTYWKWIDSLLASQFTLREVMDGTAWESVNRLQ